MAAHSNGCIAASAGIAAASSMYVASAIFGDLGPAGGCKGIAKASKKTMPFGLGMLALGGTTALLQANKTPATKELWISAGVLLLSCLPYTWFVMKDDFQAVIKADEAGTVSSVPASTWERMTTNNYVRLAASLVATGISIYALAKKK